MPRLLASPLALGLAALVLASCGSEDARLLPGETAREITANLDTVKQLSDEGDCLGAESAAGQVAEQIEGLEGVDRKLKQALEDGAARLNEVIAGCEEATTEAIAPATIPSDEESEDEGGVEAPEEKKDGDKQKKPKPEATPPPEAPEEDDKGEDEETEAPPPAPEVEEEAPSGGVSPGSPAGEGD